MIRISKNIMTLRVALRVPADAQSKKIRPTNDYGRMETNMKKHSKPIALLLALAMLAGLAACGENTVESDGPGIPTEEPPKQTDALENQPMDPERAYIEETLNLANNPEQEWTYSKSADAWTLSVVSAVVYPELPNQQGLSVCVPGAYVAGIDTNGDGWLDVTAADASEAVKGSLVIDYHAEITSSNGQTYTAATAPVILNTGAPGYGSQNNSKAAATYASEGYINMTCGNRGKQDKVTDENGSTHYTGDAPSCLADQKAAARYVKYNILLGNLPGNPDRFVSTGGSGAGAHAVMFALTGNHPDFYDYQIEAGAVGVYKNEDGSYSTTVTIDGTGYALSDGAWGCVAYSAITSLYEADMAMAFEYNLDTGYTFNTPFQKQLAAYLAERYMAYINARNYSVAERDVGFDLDGDGRFDSTVALTIEYDPDAHADTNGYYGSYLDLYLAEFRSNLQWYLDSLDYADGWTWFDPDGNALSDADVAAMTSADKARAFLEGRYTKSGSSGIRGGMMGGPGGMMGGGPGGMMGGGPGGGTTQSATGSTDSANYASYADMVAAYTADIEEICAGDKYGKNIVSLYDPLNYIGSQGAEAPTWIRIMMGAAEGDLSMFNSLNLQLSCLRAGIDANIEWQWDGGHVPSETLGESFALYVDMMYGEYVDGAANVAKPAAVEQTANGSAEKASGKDISGWVRLEDGAVSFTLANAAAYRTAGATKAIPGFDVIDYGQEDYVFGSAERDARHWNSYLLEILEEHADVLAPLFNSR